MPRLHSIVCACVRVCVCACAQEEPVFNLPAQILGLLVEVDKLVTQWRVRHAIMVHTYGPLLPPATLS